MSTNQTNPPQLVLVIIAQLLEQRRGRLRRRLLLVGDPVHAEMVVDDVGDGLSVGSGAGPAAPDCVVHLGQLVRDAVGDVGACGGAGVGAENYAGREGDGHAGWGLEGEEVGRGVGGYIEVPRLER